MSIRKTGSEILQICQSKDKLDRKNRDKLYKLFEALRWAKVKTMTDLKDLLDLHRELSKTKNRKANYWENEIARLILVDLSFSVNAKHLNESIEEEEPVLKVDYEETAPVPVQISAELLKYGYEILDSPADKTKRYKTRVKEAIRLINELQRFYIIPEIKSLFFSKVTDKDEDVQFFALVGLEEYYSFKNAEKLTKKEEALLEQIIKSTKVREIASTCCQILINVGKRDEFGALGRIDDWKEENWYGE